MGPGPVQSSGDCRCRGGDIRGFLQPRILMALSRSAACGFELLEILSHDAPGQEPDTGNLYRTLRWMEQEGSVRSSWDTSGAGPARRVYEITPEGLDLLAGWAVVLQRTRAWLDDFLEDYETLSQRRSYEHV